MTDGTYATVYILSTPDSGDTIGEQLAARLRFGEGGKEQMTADQIGALRSDFIAALVSAVDKYDRSRFQNRAPSDLNRVFGCPSAIGERNAHI